MGYDVTFLLNNADKLVNEVVVNSKFECNRDYLNLTNSLQKIFLETTGKESAVYLYGSRVYGLANEKSDLDIFLDFKNESNYYADINRKTNEDLLDDIQKSLILDSKWNVSLFVPDAKVPVLRARYTPENIRCGITVSNGMGVRNTLLLRHLIEIQPEFKKLFAFIRLWLESCNIKIRNHSLTLLVIFYLQQYNYMPTVSRVQRDLEQIYIDGWNVAFDDQRSLASYGANEIFNYWDHVYDFFDFYANFKFGYDVISTHEGRSFYYSNYYFENFCADRPMCVAGLLREDVNCTAHISQCVYNKFINCCYSAATALDIYDNIY